MLAASIFPGECRGVGGVFSDQQPEVVTLRRGAGVQLGVQVQFRLWRRLTVQQSLKGLLRGAQHRRPPEGQ